MIYGLIIFMHDHQTPIMNDLIQDKDTKFFWNCVDTLQVAKEQYIMKESTTLSLFPKLMKYKVFDLSQIL